MSDTSTWGNYGFWNPKVKRKKHRSLLDMEAQDLTAFDEFESTLQDPNRYQTPFNVPTMDVQADASRKINRGI